MSYLGSFFNNMRSTASGSKSVGHTAMNHTAMGHSPRHRIALSIISAAMIVVSVGCGSATDVEIADASVEVPEVTASATEVTTSVEVSAVKSEVSPAKQDLKTLDADASPEDVCRLFMKYLNSGNRIKAERLLTSVAFDTTAKAGLYLQPMGSADAKVEIGPAFYVTDKQQLAHVDCTITERVDGTVIEDKLTWMVRKSQSGWRIFGMVLTMGEGHQDFLSLENAQDVDTILQISGENTAAESTRVAHELSLN